MTKVIPLFALAASACFEPPVEASAPTEPEPCADSAVVIGAVIPDAAFQRIGAKCHPEATMATEKLANGVLVTCTCNKEPRQ